MLFSVGEHLQNTFLSALYKILLDELVECLCEARNTKNHCEVPCQCLFCISYKFSFAKALHKIIRSGSMTSFNKSRTYQMFLHFSLFHTCGIFQS